MLYSTGLLMLSQRLQLFLVFVTLSLTDSLGSLLQFVSFFVIFAIPAMCLPVLTRLSLLHQSALLNSHLPNSNCVLSHTSYQDLCHLVHFSPSPLSTRLHTCLSLTLQRNLLTTHFEIKMTLCWVISNVFFQIFQM